MTTITKSYNRTKSAEVYLMTTGEVLPISPENFTKFADEVLEYGELFDLWDTCQIVAESFGYLVVSDDFCEIYDNVYMAVDKFAEIVNNNCK